MDDRVAKLRDLISQRDAIDAQIAEELSIAGSPRPLTVRNKQAESSGKKKKNRCGLCKQLGHSARTCSSSIAGTAKPGGQEAEPSGRLLTEEEYNDVRHAKAMGISSAEVASEQGLDPRQVNVAFVALNYGAYRKLAVRKHDL